MKLLDVLNSPWAIVPDRYVQVRDIYLRHLGGEKIGEDTIKAIEASVGRPLENQEQGYEIVNGAALIPVDGVIAARMNLFSRISGGCSLELLTRDFRTAMADGSVRKIIFMHDSPGGAIAGIQDFAAEIFSARGKGKPVLAWTKNQMCSGSYWLAAACDKIYISNDTTQVGSIGVITSHTDISKQEQMLGVKTTPIYSGKYKGLGNKYEPLSEDARAALQEPIDYLATVFVDDVAKFRGVSSEAVRKKMSTDTKAVFIGKQAVSAGLVDGIASIEQLIDGEFQSASISVPARAAAAEGDISARAAEETKEEVMTKDEIKAKFPAVYTEILAEGEKKGQDMMECPEEKMDGKKKEGATAELARVKAVHEVGKKMPGHSVLIEGLMFDGRTDGAAAALAVVNAESGKRTATAQAIAEDAAAILVPAAGAPKEAGRKDFDALVAEHMASAKCSKGTAIRAMAQAHPEVHGEWLGKQKTGKV